MRNWYLWIVTLFMLVAWSEVNKKRVRFSHFFVPQTSVLPAHYSKLVAHSTPQPGAALFHALVTGDTRKITKANLKIYKALGLMHLLTPSGLHLSFLSHVRRWVHPVLYILALVALGWVIIPMAGYYPIKRILVFKGIQAFTSLSAPQLFAITFIADLVLPFYSKSPFSSLLSFLFWGTIITHRKYLQLSLYAKLSINAVLVNLIFQQSTSLLTFIINPVLSLIIGLCFPFLLVAHLLIPWLYAPAMLLCGGLQWLHQTILFLHSDTWVLPCNTMSLVLVFATFTRRKKLFVLGLVFFAGAVGVEEKAKIQKGKWMRPPVESRRPMKSTLLSFQK